MTCWRRRSSGPRNPLTHEKWDLKLGCTQLHPIISDIRFLSHTHTKTLTSTHRHELPGTRRTQNIAHTHALMHRMICSRVVALTVYAIIYQEFVFAVLVLHWICMILWLLSPRNSFLAEEPISRCKRFSHSILVAYVLVFCYINLHEVTISSPSSFLFFPAVSASSVPFTTPVVFTRHIRFFGSRVSANGLS